MKFFSEQTLIQIFILLIFSVALYAQNYSPPVGIPVPEFGINEQWSDYYTRPSPWDMEVPGWYYIDQYHANASNSNIFGTPDNPRATMPNPIPAGSVVEVHGNYDYAPTGYDRIIANGTELQPVFIIGNNQATVLRKWVFEATYTVCEDLEFTNLGKVVINYPSHHVSIRNNDMHDMAGKIGGSGQSDTQWTHHIVIYNNQVRLQDGWNQNPSVDLDNHGIKFGSYVEDVWVLDNVAYNNGGNFIQVGDYNNPADNQRSRRFYIGGNISYANRQSPIGIKQCSDVIISENVLHNNVAIQANAAGQAGIVYQYGPDNLWIINNHIYDSNAGISSGSNSGGIGQEQYIIGNLIHDVHTAADYNYNTNTAWSPAAIMLAGGFNRHIVNNTIYNADAGINAPGSNAGFLEITNNIIYNTTRANHIFLEPGSVVNNASVYNNIIFQPGGDAQIRWGSSSIENVAQFEVSHSNVAQDNLEADPQLLNPANGDYTIPMTSPALDTGIESSVYQVFFDLYGLDIKSDINGATRPIGNAWDIGAFENTMDIIFINGFE